MSMSPKRTAATRYGGNGRPPCKIKLDDHFRNSSKGELKRLDRNMYKWMSDMATVERIYWHFSSTIVQEQRFISGPISTSLFLSPCKPDSGLFRVENEDLVTPTTVFQSVQKMKDGLLKVTEYTKCYERCESKVDMVTRK